MTKIHINSFLGNEDPLEIESIPEGFESCAAKLEKIAKEYREMANYFRDKKIKVTGTNGYPHCGSFTVDEIDTERLKKDGIVIDFADNPTERNPLFSIDSELDRVLGDLDDNDSFIDDILARAESGEDDDDEDNHKGTYDLADMMLTQMEAPDFEGVPGTINLEVSKLNDVEYSFQIHIQDLGNDLPLVQFHRESGVFKYHCGACDETHTQSLENVHKSLKDTTALLSNFAYMVRDNQEFCMAITALDDDLRLLTHLISFDYALEDEKNPK